MKILILGCAGSGKSTLARNLGEKLDIPIFHMDQLFWKKGWVASSDKEMTLQLEQIVHRNDWIIDGNYNRFLPQRIPHADEIIYIQLPRWQNIWRVIRRFLQYREKTRPDLVEGCPEHLDWKFLSWIWQFQKKVHPQTIQQINASQKTYTILHSQKDIDQFLRER